MTFQQELSSFKIPRVLDVADPPVIGSPAPADSKLALAGRDGRPTIIVFLRHCGCPFAEKAYLDLCNLPSIRNGTINGIVISHSSPESTGKWLRAVRESGRLQYSDISRSVTVINDEGREIYAKWGLGLTSTMHMMDPRSMYAIFALGLGEGIWNRPVESGNRWQMGGAFAVDASGMLRWMHIPGYVSDLGDLHEAEEAVL